ncbi:hypothetical protein T06_8091 [Trichinella sp. T6]|nr:hypothetical protein T06_8091 [Trichinella sp. T6]
MANMPEMGLEIFNAGGGWRDQKWAPSWSVKLPSLRQGRVQTLPCSLGRQSARSSSLERGKPRLSALKRRVRLSGFSFLRCAESFAEYCDILLSCQCSPIYGANERGGELSSGIPHGAAAYHHYVYAAHLLTSVLW